MEGALVEDAQEAGGEPVLLPREVLLVLVVVLVEELEVVGEVRVARKVVDVDDRFFGRIKIANVGCTHVHWDGAGDKSLVELFRHVVVHVGVFKRKDKLVRSQHINLFLEPPAPTLDTVLVVEARAVRVDGHPIAHQLLQDVQPVVHRTTVGDGGNGHGVSRLALSWFVEAVFGPGAVDERHIRVEPGGSKDIPRLVPLLEGEDRVVRFRLHREQNVLL
mmetsp:Transcript_26071/g.61474  ORF Transcript_26071/g.61474 Transcript_26071/m.61474 type:complete len:219 (+) Transcript_26071:114-770(+)